jgi:hypothetical protein
MVVRHDCTWACKFQSYFNKNGLCARQEDCVKASTFCIPDDRPTLAKGTKLHVKVRERPQICFSIHLYRYAGARELASCCLGVQQILWQ